MQELLMQLLVSQQYRGFAFGVVSGSTKRSRIRHHLPMVFANTLGIHGATENFSHHFSIGHQEIEEGAKTR